MPHYYKMGEIPHKRHTVYRKPDGGLYQEQLVSTEGFSDTYSLVYHSQMPTMVKQIDKAYSVAPKIALEKNMQHRSFKGFNIKPADDYLESRMPVLVNNDLHISLAAPRKSMKDYFFKNSAGDEMIFVHKGEGTLRTMYGNIPFKYGDHLIIPRGVIYQMEFNSEDNRLFIVESFTPLRFPKRYMNKEGQLLEHSPFCERDIRKPVELETHDEMGDFLVKIKRDDMIWPYHYASHPFDLIGWDGHHYPFAFSIFDFEPITGRVHQPPPVHQTFETPTFVTCAFVPRLYDYHPESIPAPYNHSNVDSDEVLYYVDGDFMSRNHVEKGMISLHPIGIVHGPHPGAMERSIGQKETGELAVMVDTFKPLKLTEQALQIEDPDYYKSWLE
ncbi:MAG: homogentisate 1,2-dioxygenase [Bacteroidales bacterium]|nr:homogentisate 1,2-dioxygenase [Bacteroidales bacterium]MCF8456847.1 homogentisate 1,2-dioxygenase [Bacteroidales bacterium]